jgi:hypothetical protein
MGGKPRSFSWAFQKASCWPACVAQNVSSIPGISSLPGVTQSLNWSTRTAISRAASVLRGAFSRREIVGCGYADGDGLNQLRHDPLLKLAAVSFAPIGQWNKRRINRQWRSTKTSAFPRTRSQYSVQSSKHCFTACTTRPLLFRRHGSSPTSVTSSTGVAKTVFASHLIPPALRAERQFVGIMLVVVAASIGEADRGRLSVCRAVSVTISPPTVT